MGWYDNVNAKEPSSSGSGNMYGAAIAASQSVNDNFTKALDKVGDIFSGGMKRDAENLNKIQDIQNKTYDQSNKVYANIGEDETRKATTDMSNKIAEINSTISDPRARAEAIGALQTGTNGFVDSSKLLEARTNAFDKSSARADLLDRQKKEDEHWNKDYSLKNKEINATIARYNDEKKNATSVKLAKASEYNNSYLNSSEIQSKESKKLVGKEHTKEDDAKIAEKINIATKGDKLLDQYGNNITFADKFLKNQISETGIEQSYADRGTKTIENPDKTISKVPITKDEIQSQINELKKNDKSYLYGTHIFSDKQKEDNINLKNELDYDRKMKILEIEKQKLNPNITKEEYGKLVSDQKGLAEEMVKTNITNATNRANSYYNDASTGFEKTVDKYRTEYVPKEDKEIFAEEKARIKSELLANKNVNPEDAELAAAEGASALVKKNTENKKEYDKKITEKAKIAYENSTEKEKESLKLAKEKLDGFKGMYDSLTKANSNASSSEKDDALFEYTRAQKEYDEFVSSHLNSKASKY